MITKYECFCGCCEVYYSIYYLNYTLSTFERGALTARDMLLAFALGLVVAAEIQADMVSGHCWRISEGERGSWRPKTSRTARVQPLGVADQNSLTRPSSVAYNSPHPPKIAPTNPMDAGRRGSGRPFMEALVTTVSAHNFIRRSSRKPRVHEKACALDASNLQVLGPVLGNCEVYRRFRPRRCVGTEPVAAWSGR